MSSSLNGTGVTFNDGSTQDSARTGPRMQVFTSSGTFTVPAGITSVRVKVFGAGGGGTGSYLASCVSNPGLNGNHGGFCEAIVTGLSSGSNISVTVGTGGNGATGAYGGSATLTGTAGGTSSFGTYVTATGGAATSYNVGTGAKSSPAIGVGSVGAGATVITKTSAYTSALIGAAGVPQMYLNPTTFNGGSTTPAGGASDGGGYGGSGMSGGGIGGHASPSNYRQSVAVALGAGNDGGTSTSASGGAGGGLGGTGGTGSNGYYGGGGGGGGGGVVVFW